MQVVGVTLIAAAIVIPPIVARLVTNSFGRVMAVSVAVGCLTGLAGIYLSFYIDVSSGASIVLLASAVFVAALAYANVSTRLRARRGGKREEVVVASLSDKGLGLARVSAWGTLGPLRRPGGWGHEIVVARRWTARGPAAGRGRRGRGRERRRGRRLRAGGDANCRRELLQPAGRAGAAGAGRTRRAADDHGPAGAAAAASQHLLHGRQLRRVRTPATRGDVGLPQVARGRDRAGAGR